MFFKDNSKILTCYFNELLNNPKSITMTLFNIFLFIHITGGTIGLLAGTYIMIAKKGNKRHKLI